jgi:hypothetical protein
MKDLSGERTSVFSTFLGLAGFRNFLNILSMRRDLIATGSEKRNRRIAHYEPLEEGSTTVDSIAMLT